MLKMGETLSYGLTPLDAGKAHLWAISSTVRTMSRKGNHC